MEFVDDDATVVEFLGEFYHIPASEPFEVEVQPVVGEQVLSASFFFLE